MQIEIIQQTINKLRQIYRNLENIERSKRSNIQRDCFKGLHAKITDLNKLCQEIQTKKKIKKKRKREKKQQEREREKKQQEIEIEKKQRINDNEEIMVVTQNLETMKLTIINDLERLSQNDIVMKMLRRRNGTIPSDSVELMEDRNVLEIGYTEDLKENLQKLKDYEQFLLNEHGISAEYLNELRQERTELPVIEAIIEMSHNLENS